MNGRGVNLIPIARRHGQQRRRHLRRWAVILSIYGTIVLAACAGAHIWGSESAATSELLKQTEKRVAELQADSKRLQRELIEAQASRQAAEALVNQPDWSILLSILSGNLGDDVVLREVRLAPDAKATRSNLVLSLRGFGQTQATVSQFVLRLQNAGLFDHVKLLRTGREPIVNTSAVTFEISCEIGGASALAGAGGSP